MQAHPRSLWSKWLVDNGAILPSAVHRFGGSGASHAAAGACEIPRGVAEALQCRVRDCHPGGRRMQYMPVLLRNHSLASRLSQKPVFVLYRSACVHQNTSLTYECKIVSVALSSLPFS